MCIVSLVKSLHQQDIHHIRNIYTAANTKGENKRTNWINIVSVQQTQPDVVIFFTCSLWPSSFLHPSLHCVALGCPGTRCVPFGSALNWLWWVMALLLLWRQRWFCKNTPSIIQTHFHHQWPVKTLTDISAVSNKDSSFKHTAQCKLFFCSWCVPRVEPMGSLSKKPYMAKQNSR